MATPLHELARQADMILKSAAFEEAITRTEERMMRDIRLSQPHDAYAREQACAVIRSSRQIESSLRSIIQDWEEQQNDI